MKNEWTFSLFAMVWSSISVIYFLIYLRKFSLETTTRKTVFRNFNVQSRRSNGSPQASIAWKWKRISESISVNQRKAARCRRGRNARKHAGSNTAMVYWKQVSLKRAFCYSSLSLQIYIKNQEDSTHERYSCICC